MLLTEIAYRVWMSPVSGPPTGPAASSGNLGVVAGSDGLLVVGSDRIVREHGLADAVAAGGRGPVLAVALTHVGPASGMRRPSDLDAASAAWASAELVIHEDAAASMLADSGAALAGSVRTFSAAAVVDLGGRVVEVVHPGAGHGAGAAVVRVPDADVVWVGELIAGPRQRGGDGAIPDFGPTCHPLAWPSTLDVVLDLLSPASVVVPGRGHPVERSYVEEQRNQVGLVSQTVRDLAAAGVPQAEALDRGDWPYPRELLGDAVRRGYAALPRGARQLPQA